MRAHTTTDEPQAAPSPRTKRTIVAVGLAVALLGATASTASADRYLGDQARGGLLPSLPGLGLAPWNCPPLPPAPSWPADDPQIARCFKRPIGSFYFGSHQLGTSASQRFALGALGDTFSPWIEVTGDYAQTNNCPPTLSAPEGRVQGCLIDVTFTPTGKRNGTRLGILTTGPGGPTMALSGTTGRPHLQRSDLKLSGKKTQDQAIVPPSGGEGWWLGCDGSLCDVSVGVSCGDEACTASAKGKLTKVERDKLWPLGGRVELDPGEKKTILLHLNLKTRRQALKALNDGKKVWAKVTVRAKDAAGNVATATRTIRLVK